MAGDVHYHEQQIAEFFVQAAGEVAARSSATSSASFLAITRPHQPSRSLRRRRSPLQAAAARSSGPFIGGYLLGKFPQDACGGTPDAEFAVLQLKIRQRSERRGGWFCVGNCRDRAPAPRGLRKPPRTSSTSCTGIEGLVDQPDRRGHAKAGDGQVVTQVSNNVDRIPAAGQSLRALRAAQRRRRCAVGLARACPRAD